MSEVDFSSDPELLGSFIIEAREHVEIIEQGLLVLESGESDLSTAIDTLFRSFHTIKGTAGFLALDDFSILAADGEQLLEEYRQSGEKMTQQHIGLLLTACDYLKLMVGALDEALGKGEKVKSFKDDLADICKQLEDAVGPKQAADVPAKAGKVFVANPAKQRAGLVANVDDEEKPKEASNGSSSNGTARIAKPSKPRPVANDQILKLKDETVRVKTRVLDQLIDTIGELVVAEAMVVESQHEENKQTVDESLLSQLTKITRELQEIGTSLRMVPIRPVFRRMARVVRDLSVKLGRPVRLETEGEDTLLDKSVVDRIGDPLLHMVRNSVDHGIEEPEERHAAGKPIEATITLSARHRGGNIHIEISDDGRGIDRDKIRARAVEKGIIGKDQVLNERDTYDLLFAPGFSTAKTVTDVSGRGVGMDVVKKEIQRLRGVVDIKSELGAGTSINMRLPLTLAIIDGMVVRVGEERYVIPILSILTSLQPTEESIHMVLKHGKMLKHQDELLSIFPLHDLFNVDNACENMSESILVILEEDGKRAAIQVDELLGQQQIVIKSLSGGAIHPPGITGAAVMPDGLVGLILDVPGLMRLAIKDNDIGPEQLHSEVG